MEILIPIAIGIIGLIFKKIAEQKKVNEPVKKAPAEQQVDSDKEIMPSSKSRMNLSEARSDYYNKKKAADEMMVRNDSDSFPSEEKESFEPFGSGLTGDELVRSVVLGEILGPPKSKKPYRR
ncbi:hypothetical protein [Falsibacillus pallidus]|uniref:hypothetical protein n=1 Tax=Falsibacillus pallidus TaxID=493781 RepID=UPI003D956224